MHVKISKFLNRVEADGKIYYYSSLTDAIVELSSIKNENLMLKEIHQLVDGNVDVDNKYVKLGFLVNQDIEESKIVEYAYQKSKFDRSIFRLRLFPSYACNLRCNYCFVKEKVYNHPNSNLSEIKDYFNEINNLITNSDFEKTAMVIMGGEPLIFGKEILAFLNKLNGAKNISLQIVTNGTIIDKEILSEIVKMPFIKSFQISFDGPPSYHDGVKGKKNSFYSSINFINFLNKVSFRGSISIRINISEANKSLIKETLNLLKSELSALEKVSFYPAMIRESMDTNVELKGDYCIPEEDAYLYFSEFYSTCISLGLKYYIHLSPLLRNCVYLNENSFVVAPNLMLYKCDDLLVDENNAVGIISQGKIKMYDFANSGRVKHFNMIADSFLTNEKCKDCSWLPVCRGGCPLEENKGNCKGIMENKLKNYIRYRNMGK
jgi:uncharacterized protein